MFGRTLDKTTKVLSLSLFPYQIRMLFALHFTCYINLASTIYFDKTFLILILLKVNKYTWPKAYNQKQKKVKNTQKTFVIKAFRCFSSLKRKEIKDYKKCVTIIIEIS